MDKRILIGTAVQLPGKGRTWYTVTALKPLQVEELAGTFNKVTGYSNLLDPATENNINRYTKTTYALLKDGVEVYRSKRVTKLHKLIQEYENGTSNSNLQNTEKL
jgi:hypothetical protein